MVEKSTDKFEELLIKVKRSSRRTLIIGSIIAIIFLIIPTFYILPGPINKPSPYFPFLPRNPYPIGTVQKFGESNKPYLSISIEYPKTVKYNSSYWDSSSDSSCNYFFDLILTSYNRQSRTPFLLITSFNLEIYYTCSIKNRLLHDYNGTWISISNTTEWPNLPPQLLRSSVQGVYNEVLEDQKGNELLSYYDPPNQTYWERPYSSYPNIWRKLGEITYMDYGYIDGRPRIELLTNETIVDENFDTFQYDDTAGGTYQSITEISRIMFLLKASWRLHYGIWGASKISENIFILGDGRNAGGLPEIFLTP